MTPETPPTVLRNAHVFNSDMRSFDVGRDVVVQGERITAVRPAADPEAGEVSVDLEGCYLLPGLIDCHVHLTSSGEPEALTRSQTEDPHIRAIRAAVHARKTLEAGFTTVRDLGAPQALNVHLARAIDMGLTDGPRILAAGMGITMTGGHGHGFIAQEADGPDAVRKAVREQIRTGATAIKLFASGGVMTPGVDPRSPSLTEEEMRAGVEEAHKAFRIVGAHAQATEGIKNAIRAGVDSIEHGVWLDAGAIDLMLEHGTYLVATLTAPHHIAHGGLEGGVPPYMVEKGWQVLEDHQKSFRAAIAAGVRVAMGTDQGTPLSRPGDNAQEIVRIVENGLSPAAGILAATAWAANLLSVNSDRGRIVEGLLADLVVLPADPLADITVLTRPGEFGAVFKGGKAVISRIPTLAVHNRTQDNTMEAPL